MPAHCCVPRCVGKGGHRFPVDDTQKKRWIQAVKRGEHRWLPKPWTTVCTAHFDRNDYVSLTNEKDTPIHQRLKKDVVPHIFGWTVKQTTSEECRNIRARKRLRTELFPSQVGINGWTNIGAETTISQVDVPSTDSIDSSFSQFDTEISVTHDKQSQTTFSRGFSARDNIFDKRRFHFNTGMEDYESFSFVFSLLGETVNELNYYYGCIPSLSPEDQFYMTLMKLRLAHSNYEIAGLFHINEKEVTNIFVTWINFLLHEMKEINFWPSKDLVQFFSPSDFRNKFPSTRVIIDGTEIPLKKPKQPAAQQATYSTYKNRNTVKVLVGVTPGGLVSYVSDAYGGSTSDRQICERSDLINICDPGDSIMSDKGFNVQDMFIPANVTVNIPEFFKKKNRMASKAVMEDRKIASKRVHVERIIGLAKTFKILTKPLNNTESELADAIITVCFFLCNFKKAIVPLDA